MPGTVTEGTSPNRGQDQEVSGAVGALANGADSECFRSADILQGKNSVRSDGVLLPAMAHDSK